MELLDDSEAKYLIDQFNKYSSWFLKGYEPWYSAMAMTVAGIALMVVITNNLNLLKLSPFWGVAMYFVVLVGVMVMLITIARFTLEMTREHERNAKKLIALENYRSKHKSLPDSLTFETIKSESLQQLEKRLVETEHH